MREEEEKDYRTTIFFHSMKKIVILIKLEIIVI